MNKKEWFHLGLLVLGAFIWGMAFVAQSIGADAIGPYTFTASRSWLGALSIMPLSIMTARKLNLTKEDKTQLLKAGLVVGGLLFVASFLQQKGIGYTTTAKSGFITSLYMVIVPLLSMFAGKKVAPTIWIAVIAGLTGLYLLCHPTNADGFNIGDLYILACAFVFALQILSINYFVDICHPILLAQAQFLGCAIFSTFFIFLEHTTWESYQQAIIPILYTGICSTGIGYTLQIIGQKELNPTVASIAMCLESVFSALGGWIILGQTLTSTELLGCILMFGAVLITQIPVKTSS